MPPQVDVAHLAPLLGSVFAAAFLQGFSGFGFAIIAVPLLSLFMPPAETLPYVMAMQVVNALVGLRGAVATCQWRLLGWVALGAIAGTPVGLWAITTLSPALGRMAVSLAVIAALALILRGGRFRGRPTTPVSLAAGLASGVMNGLAGMSGPPVVALLVAADLQPAQVRSTLLVFVLGAGLAVLIPLGFAGRITGGMVQPLLLAMPALLAGGWIGSRLFLRASARQHRAVALTALAVLAVTTFVRAALELAA
ncbi:sulfite exporter TauE/SafE family protein [Phenylobacterium sp.]|uniref:sulfite exporter TauE/SafE family protein n=1 Tax=Phenylobacterium sp. TaxID=1871053 RepID=UPI0035B19BB3